MESIIQPNRKSKWTAVHMWRTYDKAFLISLGLQYFNTGMLIMVDNANNIYFLEEFKV